MTRPLLAALVAEVQGRKAVMRFTPDASLVVELTQAERDALCEAPISNQVICAAVKFADGRIARGHRHPDCYHCATGWTPQPDLHAGVQGFMDARNEFVDRREAKRIQAAAGIPSFDSGDYRGEILMSEDLY